MFGSTVLEVAVGVVFVYLSLSLVCTAAHELIASVMTWRARNLAHGLQNLLNYKDSDELLKGLYNHPLIQSLYRDGKRLPSYIPSRTFALALMDMIVPAGSPDRNSLDGIRKAVQNTDKVDAQVRNTLLVLIDETDNKLKEAVSEVQKAQTALSGVQENVETWFNDSMERVSGWYKRKSQAMTFALAVLFAFALNVDTIMITKRLSTDPSLRASLNAMAEKAAQLPAPTNGQTEDTRSPEQRTQDAYNNFLERNKVLTGLGIPLGWREASNRPSEPWDWPMKFFGLLLTAGAASLGAPFWFDMLNKIITIRSSGKAPEEKQKSPKEVPTPTEAGQSPREAREAKDLANEVRGMLTDLKASIESSKKTD
jgi:hypothetical protein